jgi:hypothetical protein
MAKTEVYSWRLSPELKQALEAAARDERASVAAVLERLVRAGLIRSRSAARRGEENLEACIRLAAMRHVGSLRGGDPKRAARARDRVRAHLKTTRARQGAH